MAISKKTEFIVDHYFDPRTNRHTVNGITHVLHCHHYASLYTQLAEDAGMLDGKKLLAESAEDAFYEVLNNYYETYNIETIESRFAIAEQYYALSGLGQMKVLCAGYDSGEVELMHSHVDEGWVKKWGRLNRPINHITRGYIAAMFSAVLGTATRIFDVHETASIVAGDEKSKFKVVRY